MTLAEMVLDLKTRIGSTNELGISDAILKVWLNNAMLMFCSEEDFTWLEKSTSMSTISGTDSYDLPVDSKLIVEIQVDGTTANPNVYNLVPYEQRVAIQPGEKKFSLFEGQFVLSPIPQTNGSNNISFKYIRRPTKMSGDSDSPDQSTIANMPVEYHEGLVIYALAVYKSYNEDQAVFESLMGSVNSPRPGTYYYFVNKAIDNDSTQKRGTRVRMLSKQEFTGYSYPNAQGLMPVLK